jgi:2-iminobutanoate/2-iminopropanoate deaminase
MKTISTKKAPSAIGPYSQALLVQASQILFLSGQVGLDPVSGDLTPGGIEEQTRQVLANLAAVLEGAGMTRKNVVKTTVFLVDLKFFEAVNRIYAGFFGDHRPARSTVQVQVLPRGALVEIEAIAVADQ